MAITPLPALDRTAATFKTDVDTFFGTQIPAFCTEANALEANVVAKEASATAAADTATTQAGVATTQVALATAQASAAAASAASALTAPGTSATSATSLSCTPGTKSLTIQTGKAYSVGQFVMIANTPTPTNYLSGQIITYDASTGEMTVFASTTGGSGTYTDWTISLSPSMAAIGMPSLVVVTATTATAIANRHYLLTNAAASAVTLPTAPGEGDTIWITCANNRVDNVLDAGENTVTGPAGTASGIITLDCRNVSLQLRFANSTWRIFQ